MMEYEFRQEVIKYPQMLEYSIHLSKSINHFKNLNFMARQKFNSVVLQELSKRINGLKAIHPQLVLKNGLSVEKCVKVEQNFIAFQNEYNVDLAMIDMKRQKLLEMQENMQQLSKNLYISVKSDYGDDSLEYESVGGTRISLRGKRKSKADKKV